jgi:hypothetical protein
VGNLVPLNVSGRKYLRQAIRKQGVNDKLINEQCVIELVDQALLAAHWLALTYKQHKLVTHFVKELDDIASLVACHMEGGFGDSPAQDNPVYRTLVKYRVIERVTSSHMAE